jgi:hypothetical protein
MVTVPTHNQGAATKRKELRDYERDYKLINDCVAGERAVKKQGVRYLPMPNPDDESEENAKRYEAYKTRAVFYNVSQRTLSGMVGEVFSRDPVEELPTRLDIVSEDADGSGLTLTQLAKRAVRYTLSMGRAGVLADYPMTEEGVTRADLENGRVAPSLTIYDGLHVINWRTAKAGNKTVLTMVVLWEQYDSEDDGFAVTQKDQYRVLRLVDGVYTVEIYRDGASYMGPVSPTDASGATFDYIPFTFIGSENNDAEIDHPPLYDLASLNVAHYRNSADYEEGVYMVGQPTPVFSGLTEAWVDNVMKGVVALGSRGGVMLPEGGSADLLQMQANTAAFEAMEHKERQMIALGAKLVEQKQVQRTATEADLDSAAETSVLADVAKNVSAAIKFGLENCARFVGDPEAEITYELNTEFRIARMTPQERAQLISEWQQGAVTFSEMREGLRKSGTATLDDAEAKTELEEESRLREEDDNDPNAGGAVDDPDDGGNDE